MRTNGESIFIQRKSKSLLVEIGDFSTMKYSVHENTSPQGLIYIPHFFDRLTYFLITIELS